MRILCNGFGWFDAAAAEVEAEHDVVRVTPDDIARAWQRPSPDWYRPLAPEGWEPEIALLCCPEYHVLPPHVAELPCPTVLWIGDWYLNPASVRQVAPYASLVLADAVGADALRRAGLDNVDVCCPWTFDPLLHRADPRAEPLHDISFVGSLNDRVQRDRARWIDRLARLSDRHRVAVVTGVWGEQYADALRRSRISFNWSVTRDVNMRCFEATACGSMLLVERGNREIAGWFAPGEECVLYGPDDLDAVVDHYLAHEDERRAIAEAGRRRVQDHAPAPRLRALVERLAAVADAPPRRRSGRTVAARKAFAFQALNLVVDERPYAGAELLLEEAEQEAHDDAAVLANRAALYVLYAASGPPDAIALLQEAAAYLVRALEADPSEAVARLNQARLVHALGQPDVAARLLGALLDRIEQGQAVARPDRLLVPNEFSELLVAWAWATTRNEPAPEAALTAVVEAEAAERLADLTADPVVRASLLRRALEARPDATAARAKLAAHLLAEGEPDAAAAELELAVAAAPLRTELWEQRAAALAAAGRHEELAAFVGERLLAGRRLRVSDAVLQRLASTVTALARA